MVNVNEAIELHPVNQIVTFLARKQTIKIKSEFPVVPAHYNNDELQLA